MVVDVRVGYLRGPDDTDDDREIPGEEYTTGPVENVFRLSPGHTEDETREDHRVTYVLFYFLGVVLGFRNHW